MSVDWFTTAAQVVNFLVLVALLRRFLFRPIRAAMQQRQERVRQSLQEADERAARAEAERQQYEAQRQDLAEQREAVLGEARAAADRQRLELLDAARDEVAAARARWLTAWQREREALLREVARVTAHRIRETARQALEHLAGADLEGRAIEVFLEQLARREDLDLRPGGPLLPVGAEITVRSRFPLDPEQARRLRAVLDARGAAGVPLRAETDDALVAGIELRFDGRKLAWTLDEYFRDLDAALRREMDAWQLDGEADRPEAAVPADASPTPSAP